MKAKQMTTSQMMKMAGHDGIISAVNTLAASIGVKVGMTAQEAARILVNRDA